MRKIPLWISFAILGTTVCLTVGCSGGEDSTSNQDAIDKYNKELPPIDPSAPAPTAPERSNMPMKGGK